MADTGAAKRRRLSFRASLNWPPLCASVRSASRTIGYHQRLIGAADWSRRRRSMADDCGCQEVLTAPHPIRRPRKNSNVGPLKASRRGRHRKRPQSNRSSGCCCCSSRSGGLLDLFVRLLCFHQHATMALEPTPLAARKSHLADGQWTPSAAPLFGRSFLAFFVCRAACHQVGRCQR